MRDYRDYEMDEREMYDERNMPRDERGRYTSSRGGRGRDYEMGDERKSDYERRYNGNRMYPDEHYAGAGYRGNWGNTPFMVERTGYPYDMMGEDGRRGGRRIGRRSRRDYGDYAEGGLSNAHLEKWEKALHRELDEHDRELLKMEKVIKRANDMRIEFDKFSEEEFYVTVLMLYTDYKDTIGKGNAEIYIKLAKDFLCDEDAELQYGEKLAAYYEGIVLGE